MPARRNWRYEWIQDLMQLHWWPMAAFAPRPGLQVLIGAIDGVAPSLPQLNRANEVIGRADPFFCRCKMQCKVAWKKPVSGDRVSSPSLAIQDYTSHHWHYEFNCVDLDFLQIFSPRKDEMLWSMPLPTLGLRSCRGFNLEWQLYTLMSGSKARCWKKLKKQLLSDL